ncbi:MAG TPA: bifunctional UDP-4-keto-pentose/UDP-xylose synthase [Acidimicrobiia bacterium]|nr:bifunctional UDP-4-keto-pentose/UDP-xylose synthase [Acidimicrobiia bacterium]
MKLLLIGAGGFIGSNLVDHLIERGEHEVVGVDKTADKLEGIEGPNFTYIDMDITESHDEVEELVKDCDVVVDLIAYANPSIYVSAPLDVVKLNFFENMAITQMCIAHGKRLIQYSTSEVYGKSNHDGAYNEETSDLIMGPTTKQRWIYAAGKQFLERILHAHGLRGDLEYTIIRPFNFVGPRFDYLVEAGTLGGPRVFAHFMSALITGGPMYLVDGGNQRRSFTHIDDASDAFSTIIDDPRTTNQIYNVGNPSTDTSIRELAQYMMAMYTELTGKPADNEIIEISGEEFYGKGYEDMDRVPPDISKLQALGWNPTRDMKTTFGDAMRYNLDPAVHASIVS